MITLRRDTERRHDKRGKHDVWGTFFPGQRSEPLAAGFGALVALDELRLLPGGALVPRIGEEAEIVTYVYQGGLAQADSTGSSGVVHAGEFQRMIPGQGIRHKETNASRNGPVHFFRITLRPSEAGLTCTREQQRFAAAQRHNVLCVVVSPDGRKGSLRIHQDTLICSSVLDRGHHLIHELKPGRSAWLHLIRGEATLREFVLTHGDGAGVTLEASVSLTAQEDTEILLVDLGPSRHPLADGSTP